MSPLIWFALCFAVSLAVTGFMVVAGIGDVPDHRSSHSQVIPTGGGLGILAAMGIGALTLPEASASTSQLAQILSLIWAMGFLGFIDDIYNLPAKLKFLLMIVIATAAVWVIGPVTELPYGRVNYEMPLWFAYGGSFFWIFIVLNIVNFMDGSNGLMVVVMGIASAVLGGLSLVLNAPQSALLFFMILAGILGLAPYNIRSKARIFAGDVGALTIGFAYAVIVLLLCQEAKTAGPVYLGPVLILPFLIDGLMTIIRRAKNKERLMDAHRAHLYQRMIQHGYSHRLVAVCYGVVTLLLAGLAAFAVSQNFQSYLNFLLIPFFVLSTAYLIVIRKFN